LFSRPLPAGEGGGEGKGGGACGSWEEKREGLIPSYLRFGGRRGGGSLSRPGVQGRRSRESISYFFFRDRAKREGKRGKGGGSQPRYLGGKGERGEGTSIYSPVPREWGREGKGGRGGGNPGLLCSGHEKEGRKETGPSILSNFTFEEKGKKGGRGSSGSPRWGRGRGRGLLPFQFSRAWYKERGEKGRGGGLIPV